MMLPQLSVPADPLAVHYIFGVSSPTADGDNLIKSFQDTLCERYCFTDRDIYRWQVEKRIVSKESEYSTFEISALHFSPNG